MPSAAQAARPLRVLITGGGTGGHLFPGLALAGAFARAAPGCDVRFAGSHYGLESRIVPARGYRLYRLPVRGLFRVSWRRRLWVLSMLPLAMLQAFGILLSFRPHLVIGVGGYASGPVLAAAILLGRTTVIQEQNATAGLTNRLLGRFVTLAFAPVPGQERIFPRMRVMGSPVREEILALRQRPPEAQSGAGRVPLVLVMGGSQGARAVNRAVTEALPLLQSAGVRFEIVHQAGELDRSWVEETYRAGSIPHRVAAFLDDMAAAYAGSRIVISRAGASAVNEIVAARRASLLIPIPNTSGDHQLMNAKRLRDAGAAVLIEQGELSGERLARELTALLQSPGRVDAMERACDSLYSGDAAAAIVSGCLELIGRHASE